MGLFQIDFVFWQNWLYVEELDLRTRFRKQKFKEYDILNESWKSCKLLRGCKINIEVFISIL